MISKICLSNFKCFEEVDLELRGVNIFTGVNGTGKSTVLQSLLLLRQSFQMQPTMSSLYLNGRYVCLGLGKDILYENARDNKILLGLTSGNRKYRFIYQCDDDGDTDTLVSVGLPEKIDPVDVFSRQFTYINAYRIEPLDAYPITNAEELDNMEFANNGMFAIQYLNIHGNDIAPNRKIIADIGEKDSIQGQVRTWLQKISPGVSPITAVNGQLRKSEVRYEYLHHGEKTGSFTSVNVGFGITYVLPVVVALVAAKPGNIVIIENPEAHLHPAGQTALGRLIARAGLGGVQVFVETHSDHIINGIRMCAKEKIIDPEGIRMFYFQAETDAGKLKHTYQTPEIRKDGRLTFRPIGFFDEWESAMMSLL